MRVLFLVPPTGAYVREERCQGSTKGMLIHSLRPPIDLAIGAKFFELTGFHAFILDAPARGSGLKETLDLCVDFCPDIVVVQTTVSTLKKDAQVVSLLRSALKNVFIVACGAHFDLDPEDGLERVPDADAVINGDLFATLKALSSERDFPRARGLAVRVSGQVILNPKPKPLSLDELPLPSRHLLDHRLYLRGDKRVPWTTVIVGRGCPHRCTFCLVPSKSYNIAQYRPVTAVIEEIKECQKSFGIGDFIFMADTFTYDKNYVLGLCEAIEREGLKIAWSSNSRADTIDIETAKAMKRAGCFGLSLGLESGSNETLRKIRKGVTVEQERSAVECLRKARILSLGYLMIGFPWEDETKIMESFAGMLEVDPDLLEIEFPYPFPGTELRKEMCSLGLLEYDEFPEDACAMPATGTLFLSKDALAQIKPKLARRFYLRKKTVLRSALHLLSQGSLLSASSVLASKVRGLLSSEKT